MLFKQKRYRVRYYVNQYEEDEIVVLALNKMFARDKARKKLGFSQTQGDSRICKIEELEEPSSGGSGSSSSSLFGGGDTLVLLLYAGLGYYFISYLPREFPSLEWLWYALTFIWAIPPVILIVIFCLPFAIILAVIAFFSFFFSFFF